MRRPVFLPFVISSLLLASSLLIHHARHVHAQTAEGKKESRKKPNPLKSGQGEPVAQQQHPHFGDGVHVVGGDIRPGTYRTRSGSSGCYYARLAGFTGSINDVLANDNTDAPTVVTILPTDRGFKSSGCGTWTQDLSAITPTRVSFGDGIFIVGTDITLGTYRTNGGSGCYYARLAGFTGSINEVLANENTDASAIVAILPSDKGFKSAGCGIWSKIQ